MKWFQAMAKGAGDQYLNIRDQEREHISKMAQIKAQYDGDALKKEKENALLFNTNFGEYTLKDDPAVSGDKWMTRENKVNAFTRDFKSWFMDGDEVNVEAYNAFKENNSQEHQDMLNEWSSRLKQYMLPIQSLDKGPGVEARTTYNQITGGYEWMKPFEDFYNAALEVDKPRVLTNVSQVTKMTDENGQSKNIVEMFDAIEGTEENELGSLDNREADEIIYNPNLDIQSIGTAMMPVLTHGMYGGESMFQNQEDYNKKIFGANGERGTHEHVAVIGNIMWNHQNKTGGITSNSIRDEEIAQAQLYYGLSNQEVLDAVNVMMPKFKVVDHGETREVIRMEGMTQTELSSAGQALDAQLRLNYVAKDLLKEIDKQNRTGLALGVDQLVWGLFGKDGQARQLYSVASDYFNGIGVEGTALEKNKTSGDLYNAMTRLKNYDKGEAWRKDQGATIEYLEITLAYNLALSEQGGGGGKAISDADFNNARKRVKALFGTKGQNKAILKKLLQVNARDLMLSEIKTNDNYAKTSKDMIKWWSGYRDNFDRVVNRYTEKLSGNAVFGGVLEPVIDEATNQPKVDASGNVQMQIKEGYTNAAGEWVPFRFDGRLSRLFTIDFGDNPDFSAEEGTQGLWDSLGEHEKLVLRSNEAHMNKHNEIFQIKLPEDNIMQTPSQILESGKEDEILTAKMEGDIAQYNTVEWWKTSENPTQVIEMHMQEIWGRNSTEGLWAMIAKEEPRFGSKGYESVSMQRIINDYKVVKGDNITDKINNLINKIQTMEGALIVGQRILKDEQKAEEDLRDNE
tara:strand:- start:21 stop:2411 length:2391 start_codon:yes stop_codon:yes gene_type:complete